MVLSSKMLIFTIGACLAIATIGMEERVDRKLSYECCAGYEPISDVVPHSRIDLDQAEMEAHLDKGDFEKAKAIYTLGGNSGAMATIEIDGMGTFSRGQIVRQGSTAVGVLRESPRSGRHNEGSNLKIKVRYTSVCKDGASGQKDVSGCFSAVGGGAISIDGVDITGSLVSVTNTYLSLASLSTTAQSLMKGQEYYAVYKAYYNYGDYAHQRVMAALEKTGICSQCDNDSRAEMAKKTSAYMNVWMRVIREMEDAIVDCQNNCGPRPEEKNCNDEPVHSWDVAAAFYVGSLEGFYGSNPGSNPDKVGSNPGVLLHELADKRCKDFGTCNAEGRAKVNTDVIGQFRLGQYKVLNGKCIEAIAIKRRIVELMSVPLVQGALKYAYQVAKFPYHSGSTERAQGAAFSAAILPRIAACDGDAARVINDNMDIASNPPMSSGFEVVKRAFESTYPCLGITCGDVGGIIGTSVKGETSYLSQPCGFGLSEAATAPEGYIPPPPATSPQVVVAPAPAPAASEESGVPISIAICIALSCCIFCLLLAWAAWHHGFKSAKPYNRFDDNVIQANNGVWFRRADLNDSGTPPPRSIGQSTGVLADIEAHYIQDRKPSNPALQVDRTDTPTETPPRTETPQSLHGMVSN